MFMIGTPFFAFPMVITKYYMRITTMRMKNIVSAVTVGIVSLTIPITSPINLVWRCRGGLVRLCFVRFRLESGWRVWFRGRG